MELSDLPRYEVRIQRPVRVLDISHNGEGMEAVRSLVRDVSNHSSGGLIIPGCLRPLTVASPYLLLDAETGEPVDVVDETELRARWVRST